MAQNHRNYKPDKDLERLKTVPPDRFIPHKVEEDKAAVFFAMGCQNHMEGRFHQAVVCYRRALNYKPDLAEAYYNLGIVNQDQGNLAEAICAYQKALEIKPGHAESNLNLGVVFQEQGRFKAAIDHYRKVLEATPDHPRAYHNLGCALLGIGQAEEAVTSCRKALQLSPEYAEAFNTMGRCFLDQGKFKEAACCYRKAMQIKPGYAQACSNLLLSMNYDPDVDQDQIFSEAKAWWQNQGEHKQTTGAFRNKFRPHKRLRIGLVSPDFRQHPVSCFLIPPIAWRNKKEYELYCYAEVRNPDSVTERFKDLTDHWRNTVGLTDETVAEIIRKDRIDILVDLAGHTAGNRLGVFLLKPAPVQVTWLGYPNTTGLPGMDYRLTDSMADPRQTADRFYTETLVRLPNGFLCYAPPDDTPEPTVLRSTKDDPITFGCFNNLSKINENVIAVWSRILHQVPGSCLLLKSKQLADDATRRHFLTLFHQKGIAAARIKMLPRTQSIRDHFALYNHVDIVLDPFPYNGTTTTCEALWMGVPVVVLTGRRHAARVGTSILTWAGLPELVTDSINAYMAKAVSLAGDLDGLKNYKLRLRVRVEQSRLCNAQSFAGDLEKVFRQLWHHHCVASKNSFGTEHPDRLERQAQRPGNDSSPCPNDHAVFYQRGIDFQIQGAPDQAILCYQKALALKPGLPEANYNMGIALLDLSRIDDAVTCFNRAVNLKPDYADAHINLGNAYSDQDEFCKAISCYRKAIELDPQDPRPYYNLGNVYLKVDRPADAVASFQKALALKPDYAPAYNSLGNACAMQGELEPAITNYRKAIDLKPEFAEAFFNLGNTLRKMGQSAAAIESFQQAIRLQDNFHEACNNLGNLFQDLGDLETAKKNYLQALRTKANFPEAHYNLGNILQKQGQTAAAVVCFKEALRLKPTFAEAHSNLGNAYKELGRYRDAMHHYNRAITLQPELAEANFNRSIVFLLRQDFRRGWEGFEWRFKQLNRKSIYPHQFRAPRWDGAFFKDRRLLVHCEQGFGDTLQFIRYLPMVKARGGTLIFETRKELIEISKTLPCIDLLIERSPDGNPDLAFDFHAPIMSLAAIFQTTFDTIPADVPYLFAKDSTAARWCQRMASPETKLKVGIVWAGKPGHTNDHNRSCDLKLFAPLGRIPGLQLYSLQKGAAVSQLRQLPANLSIPNLGEEFIDFEDTAGAVENLDLIISVDTAVAHLAGAMGKPTWLLLPFVPDWRWLLDRDDTPWYPGMRLFRQPKIGDWHPVFQKVAESLKELLMLRTAAQA